MTRLLITGKNCELSREAFSRAARLACTASHETGRAASYSGTTPESAAGGTRAPRPEAFQHRHPKQVLPCTDLEPPQPLWLEVHLHLREETGLLLILAAIALATVILVLM